MKRFVEVDGLRIGYERAGRGTPIVLLHGLLSDSRLWSRQVAGLATRFTVVAWDAPGTGESSDPPESFTFDDYVDSLAAFMDALALEPAHVLGLSWGAVVARGLHERHPDRVRSLILTAATAGWRGSLPEAVCEQRLASSVRESELAPEEWVHDWLPGLLTERASRELRDEVVEFMSDFHPAGYRVMARMLADTDTRPLLSRIQVPTLLLWGDDDRRSPLSVAEHLRDSIPGATLVVIPEAGHLSNLEQPARFNAAVLDFAARPA